MVFGGLGARLHPMAHHATDAVAGQRPVLGGAVAEVFLGAGHRVDVVAPGAAISI